MRRLLPSQRLCITTGEVRPRRLLPPIDPYRSYEETLDLLGRSLIAALRRLPTAGGRLWLSLSAGYDSRIVLAAARAGGVEATAFTRVADRTSLADRLLPPRLARVAGYEHVFLARGRPAPTRRGLLEQHSTGHVSDGDAAPLLQGQRDAAAGIAAGGWCFEVGKAPYRWLPPQLPEDPLAAAIHVARRFGEPPDTTAVQGLSEWLAWVRVTPHEQLDWRDRFHIEQRLAGWQSSKEQLYDMARLERCPVLNAARSYAIVLGLDEPARQGKQPQVDLLRRMAPELLEYPINPPDRYFGVLRAVTTRFRFPAETYRRAEMKVRRALGALAARRDPRWRRMEP